MEDSDLKKQIRVVLADDHEVVRQGIRAILERDGKDVSLVGEASTGKEVLELARNNVVDVFILDLEMPELDGIETLQRLEEIFGSAKVVILSMYDEKILVERAIRAGARGYVLKDAAANEIIQAVEEVHDGGYFFSTKVAEYLVQDFLHSKEQPGEVDLDTTLTDRQSEILRRICMGLTEKEIGYELNISPNTVHVHINNIMNKVQIHNKAGLIKYAIKMGIVRL